MPDSAPKATQTMNDRRIGGWVAALLPGWLTPNQLTMFRMALSLVILAVGLAGASIGLVIILCLVAGVSDILDGALARQRGLVTRLGALLDPLSDKFFALIMALLVYHWGLVPGYLLLLLILTELHAIVIPPAIFFGRVARGGFNWIPPKIKPTIWGKLKTFCLSLSLGGLLVGAWLGVAGLWELSIVGLWAALALGLVAEVEYWLTWNRGAIK